MSQEATYNMQNFYCHQISVNLDDKICNQNTTLFFIFIDN